MKFEIVLTDKGKEIYKGGNIEVMKPNLIKFEANSLKKAEALFYFKMLIIGSNQGDYYKLKEVK